MGLVYSLFLPLTDGYAELNQSSSAQSVLIKTQKNQEELLKQKNKIKTHLEAIQKQKQLAIQKAQNDKKKAAYINNNMQKATQHLQNTELNIAKLNEQITHLKSKIITLNTNLQAESEKFSKFLPLIERLSLYPSDTLLAAPTQSTHATIGLSIIQNLSKQFEKQAQIIIQHKQELNQLQNQFTNQITLLTQLQKKQEKQQNELTIALKQARITQQESAKVVFNIAQNAADAAQKAKTLDDAIKQINRTRRKAEQQLKIEARRAQRAHDLAKMQKAKKESVMISSTHTGPGLDAKTTSKTNAPVIGSIVSLWGSKTETGPAQGITYAPQSQATVRSPCSGLIEFAGPFRGYGHMIILNCGKNYRFVLAGMDNLAVSIGQSISKGIMIGKMPAWAGQGTAGRPTLFVQLRHGEKTINPSPFL